MLKIFKVQSLILTGIYASFKLRIPLNFLPNKQGEEFKIELFGIHL